MLSATLIELGAKITHGMPTWVQDLGRRRSRCATIIVLVVGLRRYRHTIMNGVVPMDMMYTIAWHMWASCLDERWRKK